MLAIASWRSESPYEDNNLIYSSVSASVLEQIMFTCKSSNSIPLKIIFLNYWAFYVRLNYIFYQFALL